MCHKCGPGHKKKTCRVVTAHKAFLFHCNVTFSLKWAKHCSKYRTQAVLVEKLLLPVPLQVVKNCTYSNAPFLQNPKICKTPTCTFETGPPIKLFGDKDCLHSRPTASVISPTHAKIQSQEVPRLHSRPTAFVISPTQAKIQSQEVAHANNTLIFSKSSPSPPSFGAPEVTLGSALRQPKQLHNWLPAIFSLPRKHPRPLNKSRACVQGKANLCRWEQLPQGPRLWHGPSEEFLGRTVSWRNVGLPTQQLDTLHALEQKLAPSNSCASLCFPSIALAPGGLLPGRLPQPVSCNVSFPWQGLQPVWNPQANPLESCFKNGAITKRSKGFQATGNIRSPTGSINRSLEHVVLAENAPLSTSLSVAGRAHLVCAKLTWPEVTSSAKSDCPRRLGLLSGRLSASGTPLALVGHGQILRWWRLLATLSKPWITDRWKWRLHQHVVMFTSRLSFIQ